MRKKRRMICIEPEQWEKLGVAAQRLGVSRSAIIGEAVGNWFRGKGSHRSRFVKANGLHLSKES